MMHTYLITYLTRPNVLLPGTDCAALSLLGRDNVEFNPEFALNLNGSPRDGHRSDPEVCLLERT